MNSSVKTLPNFGVAFWAIPGFADKNLENMGETGDLLFSTPPAPLNACVIRGVFLCAFFGRFQEEEGAWSM